MAILYGTQSNGETLPVQVNTFGQLVAQGLDGAKGEKGDKGDRGEQGEQGEQGPPGPGSVLSITPFTPRIEFIDDGDALMNVDTAAGQVYNIGGFVYIQFTMVFSAFGITNPRGQPVVKGFPHLVAGDWRQPERASGFVPRHNFFKNPATVGVRTVRNGDAMEFFQHNEEGITYLPTTEIREEIDNYSTLSVGFFGSLANKQQIAEQEEAALKEPRYP